MKLGSTRLKKRGIEPIVAAILLIAIAIVAGVLLYLWVSRLTASSQASTPVQAQAQVLAAFYDTSANNVTVLVKSPVAITPSDVESMIVYYANNGTPAATASSASCYVTHISDLIYSINCSVALSTGTYYARVVTKNVGTITTGTFVVP